MHSRSNFPHHGVGFVSHAATSMTENVKLNGAWKHECKNKHINTANRISPRFIPAVVVFVVSVRMYVCVCVVT